MKAWIQGLKVFIVFSLLLGIIYPLSITLVAKIFMPNQANGSLLYHQNRLIGSRLIGQKFMSLAYFQSRPSAVDYKADNSGASNLGPTSKVLIAKVKERIAQLKLDNNLFKATYIPQDVVLTSGSGLDPHISLENALMQAQRISQFRSISLRELQRLIKENTEQDFFGFWGNKAVNVLTLNLALDLIKK
ncbi:MAG: potassium-transporting ATPase subunit KdpC [Candidatus Margulisiibacteriota bacterium]|jgi:K+-transporting ATPase ATPase C chain